MDLFKYIFNVKCIDKFYHFFCTAMRSGSHLLCRWGDLFAAPLAFATCGIVVVPLSSTGVLV